MLIAQLHQKQYSRIAPGQDMFDFLFVVFESFSTNKLQMISFSLPRARYVKGAGKSRLGCRSDFFPC